MSFTRFGAPLAALAVLAAGIPVVAPAHPGLYLVTARIARSIETQTITVNATGGTFKPSVGATAVPYNATAAQVQNALFADRAIGFDNVRVTGNQGGPHTLTFQGALAGVNFAQVVPDPTGLTGGSATAVAMTTVEGGADVNYPANFATLSVQEQGAVANDGHAFGIRETNGVATGGMVNYKMLPTAYRSTMTKDDIVNFVQAQTGLQVHATCQNVPALQNLTNIFAWQNDPFFFYIPWQKTSVGIGGESDPTRWIDVVRNATGVNLTALNTVAEFTAACTNLSGTYAPADTVSNISSADVADAVAPLNTRIETLTKDNTALTTDNSALKGQIGALQRAIEDDHLNLDRIRGFVAQIEVLLGRIAR